MNDKTSRRGFLKFLGKGGAVGAALAVPGSSYAIGVDAATKGEPRTELAFNFTCACSRSLIAAVPETVGTVVVVPCDCGREWHMRWEGDHFQTFDPNDCGAFDPHGRRQRSQAFAERLEFEAEVNASADKVFSALENARSKMTPEKRKRAIRNSEAILRSQAFADKDRDAE